ncbi:hypothetical protein HK097_002629 [Rhizophlyctis rosea]|uniref:F-box domain-containing protein n=1 Tax=Rhizophlyctis rosea TaxID=64517 RepID=A0AAD5SID5_9FUNG|nr:hypothetical protein HK097_002629 [Rhizophlyctis rosea]
MSFSPVFSLDHIMLETLSNTYLLALIFSHTSVDSVLKCEQACRLWKNRYGEENWRDVAILWHAWGRQWTAKPGKNAVVRMRKREAFPVRDGFKHQLTFAASHPRSMYDVRGVSLNGEVIYRSRDESEPLLQWNVLTAPNHATALPSKQICNFVRAQRPYPEITSHPLVKPTAKTKAGLVYCGKTYGAYCHSYDPVAKKTKRVTVVKVDGPSKQIQQPASSLLAFNETVAAYFSHKRDCRRESWRLNVLRLKDQTPIEGQEAAYLYAPNPKEEKLVVTRFHILYFYVTAEETVKCDVHDFYLNQCATLEFGEDVGRFILVLRWGHKLVLFDVLKREKILLVTRHSDRRDGWFFGVTEYAVDKERKRTGDLGEVKVYFSSIDVLW